MRVEHIISTIVKAVALLADFCSVLPSHLGDSGRALDLHSLCLLVHKARNGISPNYILDILCLPVTSVPTHAAVRLVARGTVFHSKFELHQHSTFKKCLLTHLFLQLYFVAWLLPT